MKRRNLLCLLYPVLAACGGGSDAPSPQQAASAEQLGAYIGSWGGACKNHAFDRVDISRKAGTTDAVEVAAVTDYYASADCTGALLGTQTESATMTARYQGSADSVVTFAPQVLTFAAKVDLVAVSQPPVSMQVTGTGVSYTVKDGQPQWCFTDGSDKPLCIHDEGIRPGYSGTAGMVVRQGVLYFLTPSGSQYTVTKAYTRR
jgi:hypothetical protein